MSDTIKKSGKQNKNIDANKRKVTKGVGLALGSGLAKGFAHIGVLRILEEQKIHPSIIAGTSIGALAGGCYLTDKLDEFEEWATTLSRYKVFSYMDFRVRSPSLIGGGSISKLLEEHFGDLRIEQLPQPFVGIAADLKTGHEIWLRKGKLTDAMRASFALPGVFPPVELNHRLLVDGALVNPVPVSPCQALGSRMTIAVDLNADLIGKASEGNKYQRVAGFDVFEDSDVSPEEQKKFSASGLAKRLFRRQHDEPSMFGVMVSSLNIIQDRVTRSRLAGDPPDVHIKPKIGHIGLMEFEKAAELIEAGKEATIDALPEIRAAMHMLLPPNQ